MLKQSLKMVPARREHYQSKLVFLLFLVSLGMFFVASLITLSTQFPMPFQDHFLIRVQKSTNRCRSRALSG